MMIRAPFLLATGLALAVLAVPAAQAETLAFKADLSGANEVPPTTSPGKGTVTATYDTTSMVLNWQGTQSGLTGTATAAHFHGPAETGKNAGVMVPAAGAAAGQFSGSATLNEAQAKALTSGMMYFNIHTPANPGGEIRGQVVAGK